MSDETRAYNRAGLDFLVDVQQSNGAKWARDEIERLGEKVAQAYQVIGVLTSGTVSQSEEIRALDYFASDVFDPNFLPFGGEK